MDNINFENRTDHEILSWDKVTPWLEELCAKHGYNAGDISYLFCNDDYLLEINQQYLNHDTLTDIITFDYTFGKKVSADILISLERIEDNAKDFNVTYKHELCRVMAHGVLHCIGFKDKTESEAKKMRHAEEEAIQLFENQ